MRGDLILFVGILAAIGGGIVVAVVFVFSDDGGSGATPDATPSEVCFRSIPPLNNDPVTELSFQIADSALSQMIELADSGDVNGAQSAFVLPHTLTHNVDGPLRLVDEALTIRLCNEVVIVEEELVGDLKASVLAEQARKIRELLRAAAMALDLAEQ